jgi:hypothetical protein
MSRNEPGVVQERRLYFEEEVGVDLEADEEVAREQEQERRGRHVGDLSANIARSQTLSKAHKKAAKRSRLTSTMPIIIE